MVPLFPDLTLGPQISLFIEWQAPSPLPTMEGSLRGTWEETFFYMWSWMWRWLGVRDWMCFGGFVFINYKQSHSLRTTYPAGCSVLTVHRGGGEGSPATWLDQSHRVPVTHLLNFVIFSFTFLGRLFFIKVKTGKSWNINVFHFAKIYLICLESFKSLVFYTS